MKHAWVIFSGRYYTNGGFYCIAKTKKDAIKEIRRNGGKWSKEQGFYDSEAKNEWYKIEKEKFIE